MISFYKIHFVFSQCFLMKIPNISHMVLVIIHAKYFEKTVIGVDRGHYSVEARFLGRYESQKWHLVDQTS